MPTGRWGGRASDYAGMRDAPAPALAEDEDCIKDPGFRGGRDAGPEDDEDAEPAPQGRRGGRASERAGMRDTESAEEKSRDLVTDPPVSEAQRRAMFAARGGHSNIGIPESVGKEFADADPGGKLPAHAKK